MVVGTTVEICRLYVEISKKFDINYIVLIDSLSLKKFCWITESVHSKYIMYCYNWTRLFWQLKKVLSFCAHNQGLMAMDFNFQSVFFKKTFCVFPLTLLKKILVSKNVIKFTMLFYINHFLCFFLQLVFLFSLTPLVQWKFLIKLLEKISL